MLYWISRWQFILTCVWGEETLNNSPLNCIEFLQVRTMTCCDEIYDIWWCREKDECFRLLSLVRSVEVIVDCSAWSIWVLWRLEMIRKARKLRKASFRNANEIWSSGASAISTNLVDARKAHHKKGGWQRARSVPCLVLWACRSV